MKIEKPIFVLGVQRSGTTWLSKALSQAPDITYWHEPRYVWIWGNFHKPNEVLTANDLTPKIKKHIETKFAKYLQKKRGTRICEKTPSNCLRIPFIHAVFPDAKIILIIRDGRSTLRSTKEKLVTNTGLGLTWKNFWRRVKEVPIWEWHLFIPRLIQFAKKKLGLPLSYSGVCPPGWEEWVKKLPLNILLAKQWVETMEIAVREGRKLPSENYLEVRYEDLMSKPQESIEKIVAFAEVDDSEPIVEFVNNTVDPSRINKWKNELDPHLIEELKDLMKPTLTKWGYEW